MHFQRGFKDWWSRRAQIANKTQIANEKWGIVQGVGVTLYILKLLSPTEWAYIGFGTENRPLYRFTDLCVLVALIASIYIYYRAPHLFWLSMWFSATTIIVLLNVVVLQRVFGRMASPERSLLLFMCNVAQIVFMFATWYRWGGQPGPLLTSVLTFATIGYAKTMPGVAIAQIAIDFVLLAIFLSHLVGQLAPKTDGK
jgi:hypothetical protein